MLILFHLNLTQFLEYRLVLEKYINYMLLNNFQKGSIILVGGGSNPILKSTATEAFQMSKMIILSVSLLEFSISF